MQFIATIVFALCAFGFFQLIRDRRSRISRAVWIPAIWMFLAGSRPVSDWFDDGSAGSVETQLYSGNLLASTVDECLLVGALAVLATRRRGVAAVLKNNWPVVAFFAYCLLSVGWSDFSSISFKRWVKVTEDLMMVLIVLTEDQPVAAAKSVLTRSGFFLLSLSVLFIQVYPGLGRTAGGLMAPSTYVGVTTNKNELGMIAMMWGLGFLWCFLEARKRRPRNPGALAAYVAMVATAVWLLFVSDSATSRSCFYLGTALILLTSIPWVSRRPTLVHSLVILEISAVLGAVFVSPDLLGAVGRSSTLTGRTDIWALVKGMATNPLLGTGYDTFWLGPRLNRIWSLYWWHPVEAHEGYIDIYVNLGWFGIAFLAGMVLRGYRRVSAAVREHVAASNLGLAFIVVAIVYNLTESAFHQLHPVWIALLASITATRAFPAPSARPQPPGESRDDEEAEKPAKHVWFDDSRVPEWQS